MRLFARQSIWAWHPLRRLFYRGGHGVHSTFAFRLIREIVQCPYPYYPYAYTQRGGKGIEWLWFRLVARFAPSSLYIAAEQPPEWVTSMVILADSRTQLCHGAPQGVLPEQSGWLLFYCDTAAQASACIQATAPQQSWLMLCNKLRSSRESEEAWRHFVSQRPRGVVVDLYDCGIVVNRKSSLSVYKSSY